MNRPRPIFVVGAARSGTTMLGSMLGSARGCIATPESKFLTGLVATADWPAGLLDQLQVRACLATDQNFRNWVLDENSVLSRLPDPMLLCDLLESVVAAYGARNRRRDVEVWIDHTPQSLFILTYLGRMFPNAKVLHLVRDGRAAAASVLPLHWGPSDIFEAATSWSRQVVMGLAAETSALFAGRIRRVHYETVVAEPRGILSDLCEFCEIEFKEQMIEGCGFAVPAHVRGQHSLVGKKPQVDRVNFWQSQLQPRQIEIFEAEVGGLLQLLGYETRYWPVAAARTGYEAWLARLRKVLMKPYNLKRRKVRLREQRKYRAEEMLKG